MQSPEQDTLLDRDVSTSRVLFHIDEEDDINGVKVTSSSPTGENGTVVTVDVMNGDGRRMKRLPSTRSSAGAGSTTEGGWSEFDDEAAIVTAEPPAPFHAPSGYLTAGWIRRILWSWMDPFLALGTKKTLEEEDMPGLMPAEQAKFRMEEIQQCCERVEQEYQQKQIKDQQPNTKHEPINNRSHPHNGDHPEGSPSSPPPSLLKPRRGPLNLWLALWYQFGWHHIQVQCILIIYSGFKILQPLMLNQLVKFVGDPDQPAWHGYLYAIFLGLGALGQALCHHQYFFHAGRTGIDIRLALNGLIYQKALTLRTTHMMKTTTGQVINLVSNDSAKFEDLCLYGPFLWNCPIECAIVLALLYQQVGVAAFAGFGAILLLTPLQLFFSQLFGKYRRYTVQRTDLRVKTINEILIGADVMKMMNWESSLEEKVNAVRQEEFSSISRAARLKSINQAIFFTATSVVNLVTFFTMHFRGVAFTPANVFTAVTFFNIIKFPLCNFVPFAVERFSEAKIAIKRITTFLELDEAVASEQQRFAPQMEQVTKNNQELESLAEKKPEAYPPGSITMKDASFVWELTEEMDTNAYGIVQNGAATNGINGRDAHPDQPQSNGNGHVIIRMDGDLAQLPASPSSDVELAVLPSANASSSPALDSRSGLKTLNVSIPSGALVGIIGSIGSYKSSFLAACLGEMTQLNGSILTRGSIAYASQTAWIFAGTIRENILFGREFNSKRYLDTIRACQLVEDIKMQPAGDQTMIGEKGVNLSGGQRARLSCARAVYGEADIYLFDDPVAALDAVVARRLYTSVISPNGMLANKTRILVTHQTHLLTQAHIILLDHGRIKSQGSFDQLVQEGHLKEEQKHAAISNDSGHENNEEAQKKQRRKEARLRRQKKKEALAAIEAESKAISEASSPVAVASSAAFQRPSAPTTVLPRQQKDANGIMKAETSTVGNLDLGVFLKLFRAGGGLILAFLVILAVCIGQGAAIASDKWLSRWSGMKDSDQRNDTNAWVYLGFVGGTILFGIVRARSFFIFILRAASTLHAQMFHAVVYSPMRFFEANPVGRILNRFAKDQSIVDEMLPLTFFDFSQCFFMVLGSLVVVGISTPFVLIILLPIIPLFVWLRQIFLRTSRELKRLDAVTRSPVYALFSSTLSGLMIIRSFKVEKTFISNFLKKMDENTRCFIMFHMTARWFGLRLDAMAASVVMCTCLLIAGTRDHISAADAGFALSYCVGLTALFQWAVRQSAEVETMMTSVERIVEYGELPPEGALISPNYRPPAGWPATGRVEFRNYKMRYREGLDLVLKGVDLMIEPGEKVGVCGRTGAGKSSLFQSLLRLVEAAPEGGGIFIDDMEIGKLGLSDLRSNLAIIPQYPVIFSGSLRYNLDPFNRCTDAALWSALEAVQLKSMVSSLKDGLHSEMAEFGGNFSVGECQLICVARALLKPSKILLIDEATASVDEQTDALIQSVIRDKFKDRTVLTMSVTETQEGVYDINAHRLNTILDSQKIVVMAAGRVAECGSPQELLARPPCDLTADPNATFGLFSFMASQKKAAQ